jgi:hypothetical protein
MGDADSAKEGGCILRRHNKRRVVAENASPGFRWLHGFDRAGPALNRCPPLRDRGQELRFVETCERQQTRVLRPTFADDEP